MSGFPGSPRLPKGALVALDSVHPQQTIAIIGFQYNPDSLTRRLEARTAGGGEEGDRAEALRLKGPPKETITLTIEIDAIDQTQQATLTPLGTGIYPTLAALELLLYPTSQSVIKNMALTAAAMLEIVPAEAPMTLLVWGNARILPVRLTSFSITEETFDTLLQPLRAKVELSLQVLSYYDLQRTNFGHNLSLAQQIAKEVLAKTNTATVVGQAAVPANLF